MGKLIGVSMGLQDLLVVVALLFALVNGFNDGASMLAMGLSVRSIRPVIGVVVAALAMVVTPLVLGTGVATTLAVRLVSLDGQAGQLALLVAVGVAVVVTFALSSRGLPTSLSLALVGGIAGVGLGGGLAVSWATVILVLVVAAVAPLLGVGVGWVLARLVGVVRSTTSLARRVRRWHVVGFALQTVAYGANGGQKMLAVMAVAAGTASGGVEVRTWQLAGIGVMFLVGTIAGLSRVAGTLATSVVPVQPSHAVITEVSAAMVVLGTAAVGVPMSLTQAISGALLGSGVTRGGGRVRWRQVAGIGLAWVVTLPVAFGLAALVALVVV